MVVTASIWRACTKTSPRSIDGSSRGGGLISTAPHSGAVNATRPIAPIGTSVNGKGVLLAVIWRSVASSTPVEPFTGRMDPSATRNPRP